MDLFKMLLGLLAPSATCPDCNGTGTKGDDTCNMCQGSGTHP